MAEPVSCPDWGVLLPLAAKAAGDPKYRPAAAATAQTTRKQAPLSFASLRIWFSLLGGWRRDRTAVLPRGPNCVGPHKLRLAEERNFKADSLQLPDVRNVCFWPIAGRWRTSAFDPTRTFSRNARDG